MDARPWGWQNGLVGPEHTLGLWYERETIFYLIYVVVF